MIQALVNVYLNYNFRFCRSEVPTWQYVWTQHRKRARKQNNNLDKHSETQDNAINISGMTFNYGVIDFTIFHNDIPFIFGYRDY